MRCRGSTDWRVKYKALWTVPIFATATALAGAPSSDVPIDAFKGPQIKHIKVSYPMIARRAQQDGWVDLGFMVSSQGKPYAVSVLKSSGVEELEDAAIHNLEKSTFVPASLNGKPIDSGDELQFRFVLRGASGRQIRRSFYGNYVDLLHAIKNRDAKRANHLLNVIEPGDLAEDAFYAIGRARYAAAWGSPSEELSELERADLDNNVVDCLPPDEARSERLVRLALDINLHHYVEALATWKKLNSTPLPQDVRARLAPAILQIQHIRDAHLGYSVTGQIGATGWALGLLDPQFSIVVSDGKISEVRLRCRGGYLYFPFNPKLQYTVNGNYSSCGLELVGEPGTRFTLNQF